MKNFAKLTPDGQLRYPSNPYKLVVSNPSEELLRYEGYKEVIMTPPPEYDPETQYITSFYVETEVSIIQEWEIHEIPQEDPNVGSIGDQ